MRRQIALAAMIAGVLVPGVSHAQGQNPLPLIIKYESDGNPTATTSGSTSSGLAGEVNGTWRNALAYCGAACGSAAQYPTAASAPASVQIAATNALINNEGLQPWLCPGCDAPFARAVAARGGAGAFQTTGLDTNPAHFASADTPAGLQAFLLGNGIPNGTGTTIAPAATGTAAGSGGAPTSSGGTTLSGGILDQILQAFLTATQAWQAGLFTIAIDLFWLLAMIDLAVSLIMLVIRGGHPDWIEVAFTIILWMLPVGLFLWLMTHGSEYAGDIVNSLRYAANAAGGTAITPSAVLTAGINATSTIWTQFASFFHPVTMTVLMLAVLVILICFSLMAVWMAAALIEGYFVIGAAALILAFGAMRWTRQIGVSLLLYCLALGMKLFAISMIVAVGNTFVQQWAQIPPGETIQGLFTLVGAAIFLAAVAKVVPDTMQRIILNGPIPLSHYDPVLRQAAGTAALAAAPVLTAAGFGALAFQAFREAAEKLSSNPQQTGSRSASGMLLGVGQSLASAAGSEISGRLGGLYRGGAAASATRMASRVAQSRRVAAAQQARPQPPTNTP